MGLKWGCSATSTVSSADPLIQNTLLSTDPCDSQPLNAQSGAPEHGLRLSVSATSSESLPAGASPAAGPCRRGGPGRGHRETLLGTCTGPSDAAVGTVPGPSVLDVEEGGKATNSHFLPFQKLSNYRNSIK